MFQLGLFHDTGLKFCLMIMEQNGEYESRFDVAIIIHIPSNCFCNLLRLTEGESWVTREQWEGTNQGFQLFFCL